MLDGRLPRIARAVGKSLDGGADAAERDQLAAAAVEDAEDQVFGLRVADDRTEESSGRRAIAARRGGGDPRGVGRGPELLQPVVLQHRQPIVGAQRVLDQAVVGRSVDGATHLGAEDGNANHAHEEDEHDEGQNDTPPE